MLFDDTILSVADLLTLDFIILIIYRLLSLCHAAATISF